MGGLRFGFCGRLRGSGLRGFRLGDRCLGRGFGFRCGLGGDCCGFFLFRQRAAGRFQAVFAKFGVFVQQQGALLRVIFHGPIGKGVLFLLGKVFRHRDQHIFPEKPVNCGIGGVAAVQPLDDIQPADIAQLGRCCRQFTPLQHRHKLADPNTDGIADRLCRSRKERVPKHPAEPGDSPGAGCIIRLCQLQQDQHVQRLLAVFRCAGQCGDQRFRDGLCPLRQQYFRHIAQMVRVHAVTFLGQDAQGIGQLRQISLGIQGSQRFLQLLAVGGFAKHKGIDCPRPQSGEIIDLMPGIDPGAQGLADIAQAHILRVADHRRRQGAAGIVQLAISGVVLDGIQGAEIPQRRRAVHLCHHFFVRWQMLRRFC